jgi:hypothetical protein
MDSSLGSLKIQTFKKLPTIAPKMIEIRPNILLGPSLLGSWNNRRTMEDWNTGMLEYWVKTT